jgi:hypothetical protein
VPGEDAGAVAGFEDELGLGLSDDAVHGDVLKDEVAQGLGALGGHVEVEVVVAGDLEDAGGAGQVGDPQDLIADLDAALSHPQRRPAPSLAAAQHRHARGSRQPGDALTQAPRPPGSRRCRTPVRRGPSPATCWCRKEGNLRE